MNNSSKKYEPFEGANDMAPIQDWLVAIFYFFWDGLKDFFPRARRWMSGCVDPPFEEFPHGTGNGDDGLVVILHGYRASVRRFVEQRDKIAREVEEHYPVVFSPVMTYQHNGAPEQFASHVFDEVENFAKNHPEAPILIVGISAGGRVAWRLEKELRNHNNPLHLVTVGTPLHGTSVVYVSPWLARKTCGDDLFEEFHPESGSHEELHKDNDARPEHHTLFHFSSKTDWVVFPPHRCFSERKLHRSVTRCSHNHLQTSKEVLDYLSEVRPGKKGKHLIVLD